MEDNEKKQLLYVEPPRVPANFQAELLAICGLAPNNQPYLRFIWGMDSTEIWGKETVIRYPDSNTPPKYVGLPFYVLEGWQASDVYNRKEWEDRQDFLGPFPRNGVYDFIEVLRGEDGEMIPLGEKALAMARSWRFWKTKPTKRAVEDLLDQRAQRAILQEARAAESQAKIYDQTEIDFIKALENMHKTPEYSFAPVKQTPAGIILP